MRQAVDIKPKDGPAILDISRFEPSNRRRLSAPALRTFLAIADLWGLTEEQRHLILGSPRAPPSIAGASRPVSMATFLHTAPEGMRFNGPELGAWYASKEIETAAAEVGHHLRREALARNVATMSRTYRTYCATLLGEDYRDIRTLQVSQPDIYRSDSYGAAQRFGEAVRTEGKAGILFDSLRRRSGMNIVSFIPPHITDVIKTDHFEINVEAKGRAIQVRHMTI